MRTIELRALLLSLALLLAACGPDYSHMEFEQIAISPGTLTFTSEKIVMSEAAAARVSAQAYWDNGEAIDTGETSVRLTSADPDIFGADTIIGDSALLFYGIAPGDSFLVVRVDGDVVERIPVKIVPQKPGVEDTPPE
ncbi:MAG: hypothetical protein AMXMBFR64_44130 [Myxococcales bacterium]